MTQGKAARRASAGSATLAHVSDQPPKKSLTLSIQDCAFRIVAVRVAVRYFVELAQQLLLTFGQLDRRLDDHVAKKIARCVAAYIADALATQAEISISPPSAAVVKLTGISQCRSSPSRWKTGCDLMWIST